MLINLQICSWLGLNGNVLEVGFQPFELIPHGLITIISAKTCLLYVCDQFLNFNIINFWACHICPERSDLTFGFPIAYVQTVCAAQSPLSSGQKRFILSASSFIFGWVCSYLFESKKSVQCLVIFLHSSFISNLKKLVEINLLSHPCRNNRSMLCAMMLRISIGNISCY